MRPQYPPWSRRDGTKFSQPELFNEINNLRQVHKIVFIRQTRLHSNMPLRRTIGLTGPARDQCHSVPHPFSAAANRGGEWVGYHHDFVSGRINRRVGDGHLPHRYRSQGPELLPNPGPICPGCTRFSPPPPPPFLPHPNENKKVRGEKPRLTPRNKGLAGSQSSTLSKKQGKQSETGPRNRKAATRH